MPEAIIVILYGTFSIAVFLWIVAGPGGWKRKLLQFFLVPLTFAIVLMVFDAIVVMMVELVPGLNNYLGDSIVGQFLGVAVLSVCAVSSAVVFGKITRWNI